MSKKSFWHNSPEEEARDSIPTEQSNYLLIKENETLRLEVDLLREQLHESKTELSRIRMTLYMIKSIIKDNVVDKIDFIREIIQSIQQGD